MTQGEQQKRIEVVSKEICASSNGSWIDLSTEMGEYVCNNPTDFGLVTLETMFEFCQWVSEEDEYYYLNGSWRKSADPQDKPIYLTASELFQIFKTK